MGNQSAVLVVWAEPLRTGGEKVLPDEWTVNVPRVGSARATGAQVDAARALGGPVLAEPIGGGKIQPAQVGSLQHIRPGLHVVVGHAQ